jgi:hypothetical protein
MDFFIFIHGLYYNLTNVTRIQIQFNSITNFGWTIFLSKNEPLISAYTKY